MAKSKKNTNRLRRFVVMSVIFTSMAAFYLKQAQLKASLVVLLTEDAIKISSATNESKAMTNKEKMKALLLPKVTLLLSYPNSGTSFTLAATKELSNTTIGTNYEQEAHKGRSMYPWITGKGSSDGKGLGPYFLREEMNVPKKYVLTKTHCTGYSNNGDIYKYIVNEKEFEVSCTTVSRWAPKLNKVNSHHRYDRRIMPTRAVRLVRDPFDNIVSNYHHWMHNIMKEDDPLSNFQGTDVERFQVFCKRYNDIFEDKMKKMNSKFRSRVNIFRDKKLRQLMVGVPCHQFFFRYVQWHNNANHISKKLNTLLIHYDDYETKYEETISKLVNFLELETVGADVQFKSGKTYRNLFTEEEQKAISLYIRYLASPETLGLVSSYLVD